MHSLVVHLKCHVIPGNDASAEDILLKGPCTDAQRNKRKMPSLATCTLYLIHLSMPLTSRLVMLALCWGFPPPKQQTCRHVAQHVSVLAPTCRQHQALLAPQMLCRCQLPDMSAARWCLGRCVGRPLKVVATLGHGGSGGR